MCKTHYVILGVSTIREIVYEVCGVIVSQLMDRFVQTPQTSDDWLEVAAGFGEKWDFPHCIGRLCHFATIVCTHTLDMIVICSQGAIFLLQN